jgi:hypothetical protein
MEIVVHLPDSIGEILTSEAARTGRAADELIAEALRDYLGEPGSNVPQSFGVYDDPELSGADSEDWLRANWRPT